jgi:hypothetical protein
MTINGRTFGRNFWRQALERAIKTAAQAGLLTVGGDAANWVGSITDRPSILAAALSGGFLVSFLTSFATAPVGEPDDPSAVAKTTP